MSKQIADYKYDIVNDEPEPEIQRDNFTDEEIEKLSKIFKNTANVDKLIKNPFVCNSDFEVRVSLDKDPRNNKGNTDYIDLYENDGGVCQIFNHLDNNMNYKFGKNKIDNTKEYSIINRYDYEMSADFLNGRRTDGKELHKDALPLSFIQITNEKEGALWYKMNYPKIPDDLIPIIARYHWGEAITKKGCRNEKKKIIKKAAQKGLKIEHKKVSVVFD